MCFRPSALAGNEPQVQTGTCPSCGMPVPTVAGVMPDTCPHCGKSIPPKVGNESGGADSPTQGTKIL